MQSLMTPAHIARLKALVVAILSANPGASVVEISQYVSANGFNTVDEDLFAEWLNDNFGIKQKEPEDYGFNNPDDFDEDAEFLRDLAAMDEDDEDGPMMPGENRPPNPILSEIEQIVRPSSFYGRVPTPKETWRNIRTAKVFTILGTEQTQQGIVVSCSDGSEVLKFKLTAFQEQFEKYTPSDAAANSPPQAGEEWQNIHTGFKFTINNVVQARQGLEVVTIRDGKTKSTDIRSFVANHRRVKGSSQWFVGALKFGK